MSRAAASMSAWPCWAGECLRLRAALTCRDFPIVSHQTGLMCLPRPLPHCPPPVRCAQTSCVRRIRHVRVRVRVLCRRSSDTRECCEVGTKTSSKADAAVSSAKQPVWLFPHGAHVGGMKYCPHSALRGRLNCATSYHVRGESPAWRPM